jgi:type I restriction enzyme R subunit
VSTRFTESVVEEAGLAWLEGLGYTILHGPDIAPGEPFAEREDYGQVVLDRRLRQALQRLNPQASPDALDEAFRRLTRPDSPSLAANNHAVHRYLVEGVPVEYQRADGTFRGDLIRTLDHDDPENNEFLAINQFTVVEERRERRPDVVLLVNGLPLAVIELKNPADESADVWRAFNQLQTYKQQIPSLFVYNEALLVSDGVQARVGTLTADREWFLPWRTVTGEALAAPSLPELQVVLEGAFDKRRFLDLIRHFIVFEDVGGLPAPRAARQAGGVLVKKMAGYHQYHAVNVAVEETVRACVPGDEQARVSERRGTYLARPLPDAQPGDRRVGVVWHTQGAGKSLTMAFYAGRVVLHPAMQNPTLVVITDRNDLDDQLYGTFARCHELLRQQPVQAQSRAHLRELLRTGSGGVVFTTVHKFFPPGNARLQPGDPIRLSDRRNVVVIADEAHRSQYDFIDGFARHMRDALPRASFIAFTGTPIELADRNTRAVFGDYISVYDIQQAVYDGATVPIYYEGRLARLALDEDERPKVDPEFEEATEGEEVEQKEYLKTKWAQLEAIVGAEKRIGLIAQDLVDHFEHRLEAMDGKAMIVGMSRRICVDLYNAIVALRPTWHHDDDDDGIIKIVMTGSASDPLEWQPHIRNKAAREEMARRFKDPQDPFKVVIVRDMWLTGFDAPCLHTMYVDKPMRSHGLMQAIARVNRVFKDKPGGLVVDYLGLANELRQALAVYTESGGQGRTAIDQNEAVAVMLEKYEICVGIFHLPAPPPSPFYVYAIECEGGSIYIGQTENLLKRWGEHKRGVASDWTRRHKPTRIAHYEPVQTREEALRLEAEWKTGFGRKRLKRLIAQGGARQAGGFDWSAWTAGDAGVRLSLLPAAQEHVLQQQDGKNRLVKAVTELSRAFALAVPHDQALEIRDDVAFFQAVKSVLTKRVTDTSTALSTGDRRRPDELDYAIRQIVSRAVASEEVIDIFAAAGLKKPDISILSDEFLAEVRGLPQRNLAVETLRKLLEDEIKTRGQRNIVQARSFAEMLENAIRRYQNRAIEAAAVIEELISLAQEMREADRRGEQLGLTEEEIAFYDALEVNDSAVQVLGDETLRTIAQELVQAVRNSVTIDWTLRENVRAKIRVMVKRILRRYGYPPDKQEKATQTVLEQAEVLCREWVSA